MERRADIYERVPPCIAGKFGGLVRAEGRSKGTLLVRNLR